MFFWDRPSCVFPMPHSDDRGARMKNSVWGQLAQVMFAGSAGAKSGKNSFLRKVQSYTN
ncbi:hypothetical protein TL5118_03729 [Thalassovita autumnalis]|uniref:Uncharacterized protein n=1 Tax=Thalassovita autumnalis TaxID=2072972 RepID=A0A0P1G6K5_9RHOB|nr:hypothetical protein TL5118_03729 [Thalassovita autumnalis]CUH73163.1 hypothetical protein TL5120_02970 [Thalassovita autumnalis]